MDTLEQNFLKYLINLRFRLYEVLTDITDSEPYNNHYNPLKTTIEFKSPIEKIINFTKEWAEIYGLYYVKLYFHKSHGGYERVIFDTKNILGKAYEMDYLPKDNIIEYSKYNHFRDISFRKNIKCPVCYNAKKPHDIKEGYILVSDEYLNRCKNLVSVVNNLYEAFDACTQKGIRSKIREHILETIIKVNDLIYSKPIKEYIDEILEETT